jgi:formylglycine-generating enzyme required for sulfatase activity
VGLPVTGRLDDETRAGLGMDSSARGVKIGGRVQEQRLALVIGNGAYKSGPLRNSVNDAHDMTATLRELGFEVIYYRNADQRKTEDAIRQFGKRLRKGGVGLFYFAGHGMQLNGRNYLIPVDARIETESDVKYEAVDAGRVLGKMEDAGNRLNIVILDACRDNPFSRSFRNADKGLARMDAPTGSLIAYATAPGQVAAEGEGRNGVYTKYLLKHMTVPGWTIEQVLKRVRVDVIASTGDKQVPWESSSLTGNFYFASSSAVVEKPVTPRQGASISVESNVRGANVFVDARNVGVTPLSNISISVGKHVVLVEKSGYAPYQKRVTVEPSRSVSLYVHMSAAVKPTGRLFVDTDPKDAGVRILNINPKFYQGIELEEGRYQVEVSADGYKKQALWVGLRAGEDKTVGVRLMRVAAKVSDKRLTNSLGMKFVAIPAGSFMMGSPSLEKGRDNDEKQHKVILTKGFYIQTTEVTQGQWRAVMGNNPSRFKSCGDGCPVEGVSWFDAREFIRKLNRKEGTDRYRLPTEAEWEYAARAGSGSAYSFGNNPAQLSGYVWYSENSGGKTHFVSQKKPNAWGLYDMHGNVWEWCQDWNGNYPSASVTDPKGTSTGSYRVHRGGSFYNHARICRSANRGRNYPRFSFNDLGFRLARTP